MFDATIRSHYGIIVKIANRYWYRLPPHTQAWYGKDDLVHDVVCHVVVALRKYDNRKAKASTFIYVTARNYCRQTVDYYQTRKRNAVVVELPQDVVSSFDFSRCLNARMGVENVLADASDELRRLLAAVFGERRHRRIAAPSEACCAELRKLACKHAVCYRDFLAVARGV